MGKKEKVGERYKNEVLNLAFDTLGKDKQALVFVNTRRSAEAQAEKIADKVKDTNLKELSDKILNVLSSPTAQCKRLAKCVKKGVAFHHSGLHSKQRSLVEDAFKNREIKIICATPTLAMGVDMPAYRVIVRDLRRFGGKGMQDIPVLEYEQMSGRAGRPSFDDVGESVCIAKSEDQKEKIWEKYVNGDPEEIVSKLAVEPVLRIYVLSLIASRFCNDKQSLYEFFEETFYAHQYKDSRELHAIIDKMIDLLQDWEFIKTEGGKKEKGDFVSAAELASESEGEIKATRLGKRVSELYLDPYTANHLIECLRKAGSQETSDFSWLHMICHTLEMRPLLRVKKSEYEEIRQESLKFLEDVLVEEPSEFDYEYDRFLNSMKTALFMNAWINEKDEDWLMENYDIRPGGVHAKLDIADWLLYSTQELANILQFKPLLKKVAKIRERVKYGVKEELLPLLKLKHVGRVRARKMHRNSIKDIGDVKKVDVTKLVQLLGKKTALKVKKQVGQDFDAKKVPKRKRKGQISLEDFGE